MLTDHIFTYKIYKFQFNGQDQEQDEGRSKRIELKTQQNGKKFVRKVKKSTKKIHNRIITRRKVYKTIERNLLQNNLSASCLLKAICETSRHSYSDFNGVLGDIFHIVFT